MVMNAFRILAQLGRSAIAAPLVMVITIGFASPSFAGVTYNFLNDSLNQNGWKLNGTITVTGTGTISDPSGITAWSWTATKGLETYSGASTDAGSGVGMNGTLYASPVWLTLANGSQLQFQDPTYLYYVTSSPQSYSAVSGGSTLWNSADYSYFGPYGWYIARIPPSPVPEIDPTGMGSVVALLAGAFGLLERCRLKVKLAV